MARASWRVGSVAVLMLGIAGVTSFANREPAAVRGRLTVAPGVGSARVGEYRLDFRNGLTVTSGGRVVWAGGPGQAFLHAARGEATYREARGMATMRDHITRACPDQTVSSLREAPTLLLLRGELRCADGSAVPYALTLSASGDTLSARLSTPGAGINRLTFSGALESETRVTGGGEQFGTLDLRNRRLPILASEQGVGRGEQPITFLANVTQNGAGGTWHSTYAPMPHLLLLDERGGGSSVWSLDTLPSVLDTRGGRWRVEGPGETLTLKLAAGKSVADLTRAFTEDAGRMNPLPAWTQRGAIVAVQGGTARVREIYARLRAARVPVAGLWLQDWVGSRRTTFGKQL